MEVRSPRRIGRAAAQCSRSTCPRRTTPSFQRPRVRSHRIKPPHADDNTEPPMPNILIVDDDRETCTFMTELLAQPDREIQTAHDPVAALGLIARRPFDLIVSDINLNAHASGLDLLREFKAKQPAGQVVLISGFGTLETAIEALRAGAFDYVSKPFNIGEIKATVARALAQAAHGEMRPATRSRIAPEGLLGSSAPMLEVYKQIARAADSTAPVLIQGE